MKIKLANGLPFHPRTGERALRVVRGVPVWTVKGASGEDDTDTGDKSDGEDGDKPDEDADKGKGDKEKDTEGSDKKLTPEQKRIKELEEALAQRKTHLSEADKKREAAEKELQKIKDKDLSELERTKKEVTTLTESNTKLAAEITKLRVGNAFHNASGTAKIQWHNPAVALKTLDANEIEVDDDGNVTGMEAAVKKLAKEHKYLVSTGKDDEDKDTNATKDSKRGPSGNGVGSGQNGGKGNKDKLSKEELNRRFPALYK